MSSLISSAFAYSLAKSLKLKILLFEIYLSLLTRFYNLSFYYTILARSYEKASADSENCFVLWEAFLTWLFLYRLSS